MRRSSFVEDFKKFAFKGNVIDLAVGVIIGGAFGKIVTSLVSDIIMPLFGLVLGGVNFKSLSLTLEPALFDSLGRESVPAVTLNYGLFLQSLIDFLIIAVSIFVALRIMMRLSKQSEGQSSSAKPVAKPSPEVDLLREIRDLLKSEKAKD